MQNHSTPKSNLLVMRRVRDTPEHVKLFITLFYSTIFGSTTPLLIDTIAPRSTPNQPQESNSPDPPSETGKGLLLQGAAGNHKKAQSPIASIVPVRLFRWHHRSRFQWRARTGICTRSPTVPAQQDPQSPADDEFPKHYTQQQSPPENMQL